LFFRSKNLEVIFNKHDITLFRNALTVFECEKILDFYNGSELKRPGKVGLGNLMEEMKDSIDLSVIPGVHKEIDSILYESSKNLMNLHNKFYSHTVKCFNQDTGYQIQRYHPNKGHYDWHCDFDDGNPSNGRQAAIIWYLNDVKSGGETEFYNKLKIKPKAGNAVIFPPFWTHKHRGCKSKHEKTIVTTFILH
jgi:hypothetical protein